MTFLLLFLLAAAPQPESTRALVIRCGGEKLIGVPVRGAVGPVREFVDQVEHARVRCHILQHNGLVPASYDCEAGACELVKQVAWRVRP